MKLNEIIKKRLRKNRVKSLFKFKIKILKNDIKKRLKACKTDENYVELYSKLIEDIESLQTSKELK